MSYALKNILATMQLGFIGLAALGYLGSDAGAATLIGSPVMCIPEGLARCSQGDASVSETSSEFFVGASGSPGDITVDVQGDAVILNSFFANESDPTFGSPAAFVLLFDPIRTAGFSGISVSNNGVQGFDPNGVIFGGSGMRVNLASTVWDVSDSVRIDFLVAEVPEPSTLLLAAIGVAAIASRRAVLNRGALRRSANHAV